MLRLHIPRRLDREFRAAARAAWPREHYALLLGTVAGDRIDVDALWTPEDVREHATRTQVQIPAHWLAEAAEEATEDGGIVLGDLHTHAFRYSDTNGALLDRVQSEADHDHPYQFLIQGVCVVQEQRSGRLITRVRYWGPTARVETIYG